MIDHIAEDTALKTRHRATWELGDYAAIATDYIPNLGARLVDACRISPGDRVLDVAAGAGNAAVPAALAGADVVASDLAPALLEAGKRAAARRGASLTWQEADAEALPFADGEFDCVMSCVGVMFAPRHQQSADELVRACRQGGTIGTIAWTPEGFIGQMFAASKPYAPPPPPGAQLPLLWGDESHVRELLGDRVTDLQTRRETVVVDQHALTGSFREDFATKYGPMVGIYASLADEPERRAELDDALDTLAARNSDEGGVMRWEYLLLTATRR